jgi:hypothetical protein
MKQFFEPVWNFKVRHSTTISVVGISLNFAVSTYYCIVFLGYLNGVLEVAGQNFSEKLSNWIRSWVQSV